MRHGLQDYAPRRLTTLHNFDGYPTDGALPWAPLVQATDGDLYGTTLQGGANNGPPFPSCTTGDSSGCGTIFKINSKGKLSTVYSFCALNSCTDGIWPSSAVIQATDGYLYGTTQEGGIQYVGTIFKIVPGGLLTTLHSFDVYDGASPYAGLVQATNGTFYGTTVASYSAGAIFSEAVGLGPFITTLPNSRTAGQRVIILGNNLTGATSLTFNGTLARFSVISSTEISTTVPAGATTGPVQVVTPSDTPTSNVSFRVE